MIFHMQKKLQITLKVPLEIIKVDSQKLCEDFESMIIQLDEPLADPAALNVKYISHSAKKKGHKGFAIRSGRR